MARARFACFALILGVFAGCRDQIPGPGEPAPRSHRHPGRSVRLGIPPGFSGTYIAVSLALCTGISRYGPCVP